MERTNINVECNDIYAINRSDFKDNWKKKNGHRFVLIAHIINFYSLVQGPSSISVKFHLAPYF